MQQNNIALSLMRTHKAAVRLRNASDKQVEAVLTDLAKMLEDGTDKLLKVNAADLSHQEPDNPKNDRLRLTPERIAQIAQSIRKVAKLPDPSGKLLLRKVLPNKLQLEKITVPLGVVGAIYESRPNVTFDIAALCLRSKNACVLKGSIDAENSNHAAVVMIKKALRLHGLPAELVNLLPSDRSVVQQLLHATRYLDVIIPRGSASLIDYVRHNSLVPVIETGAGVCHVYVHEAADLKKAVDIVVNAKVSRPSVCNAMDTVIVDKAVARPFLQLLAPRLAEAGVELFADVAAYNLLKGYPELRHASSEDFAREFLSLKAGVKVVRDMDAALAHIAAFGTKHSEAIVSKDKKACDRFLQEVDAAAVYANASTRFTDGEEFGLGAEIGISTQKLHARGPFALEKLVTEKWIIRGNGQIR